MARCAVIFALVFASATLGHSATLSPVQKVISLIDDFAAKVQKDRDVASKQFEAEASFCDDESVAKGYAIKDTKEQIETLSATIEEENAKLVEFGTNIESASSRISDTEGELYKTTTQRNNEHKDFLANEKELVDTVTQLESASAKMKKTFALAQVTPAAKKQLSSMLGALSQIVEASFVTHEQREKVRAFLQSRADAEDDLSYSSKNRVGGDSIIETLEQMTEKAEGTLSDARKAEMQSNHEFMMLKQGMDAEIKSTNEELSENTNGKALSMQVLAQAEKDLGVAKRALADDTEYLADLKRNCMTKAEEWEVNHRDSVAESKALSAAKAILTKKFSSALIESKMTLKVKMGSAQRSDDPKARALKVIADLGRKFRSTALVSLAYRAASDPFGKVRGMVEDMIAKLQQQAAEEATQKAFCDEELSTNQKKKEKKEGKLEKVDARIEKAEAGIAKLSGQIATLSTELAEIKSAVKVATDLRHAENASYRTAEADFSESQEACAQALEVLREYYEGAGASFAQVDQAAKRDASGIIGLLEVAESDFAKMLADARTTENAAVDDFKKLTADSKLSTATKSAEQKGKESEVKSLKTALANSSEDSEGISTELDAVLQYLAELKPQCETKVPSYAEIKAKRQQEIEGLKDALEILSE